MTTEHIPQVDQVSGSIRAQAERFLNRETAIAGQGQDLQHERNMIAIGAAVSMQQIDDRQAVLDEELRQQEMIRRRAQLFLNHNTPAPADAADNPPPADADVVVVQPDPNNPPAPAQVVVAQPAPHPANPRHWGWLAWLCAIVLALIGLLIARNTWEWFAEDVWEVTNDVRYVLGTIWHVALTATGFFIGGLIGSTIEARRARRAAANQNNPQPAAQP